MTITDRETGTNVAEIADGIFRINTPVAAERHAGRVLLQPVSRPRRRAAALPYRAAALVSAGARCDRRADAARAAPLCRLLACRGRRMRRLERAPGDGAAGGTALRPDRGAGLDRRSRRPSAGGARRRRGAEPRQAPRALARRAAPAAWLGLRLPLRGDHGDAVLRRSLHPAGRRRRTADRGGRARPERGVPQGDGLLRPLAGDRRAAGEARRHAARHPRLHAWQRLGGRRRRAARGAWPGASPPDPAAEIGARGRPCGPPGCGRARPRLCKRPVASFLGRRGAPRQLQAAQHGEQATICGPAARSWSTSC